MAFRESVTYAGHAWHNGLTADPTIGADLTRHAGDLWR
jgi:hypothetical protein